MNNPYEDDNSDDYQDDYQPEPPVKNEQRPCKGCGGRGFYIGEDIDAGWQLCRDCMGTGDNKVAEQRDWW